MASSLSNLVEKKNTNIYLHIKKKSNLVNNLSEGFHGIRCKLEHDDKNVKHVKLNIKI